MNANLIRLREVRPDYWELDFVGSCGNMDFPAVVKVIDAQSRNPGIRVDLPFGLRGMKRALAEIERVRKEKYSLTTMH